MSKQQRIAAYFTDGASRWALVDNLGLVNLGHAVLVDESCPIRANAAPVIEMLAGGLRPDEPLIIFPGGAEIKKLADHHPNYLTEIKAIEYKVILQKHQLFVWFEDGYQVWFNSEVRAYLSPTFIYNLYLELISSPTQLISRFPIVNKAYKTLVNYKTCHKDYFGWVSPEDYKANPSFANAEPIAIKQYASRHIDMFRLMTPPSLSVMPDKPNTQRIPAKEGSKAVWDADTMVKHILGTPCPLKHYQAKHDVEATRDHILHEPTEIMYELNMFLQSTHPGHTPEEALSFYVYKDQHPKFYQTLVDYVRTFGCTVPQAFSVLTSGVGNHVKNAQSIGLVTMLNEMKRVNASAKPKQPVPFRMEISTDNYLNIISSTGCLLIYQKGDALNTTLKELYKLRELTLIGNNTISAQTLLAVFEDTTLTLQNSQLIGNIISIKGRNIFRNVLVETGAFEDVTINAKPI